MQLPYNSLPLELGRWTMTLGQTEYRSKIRREMSRDAIALAMENRWEEASVVNSSILELFPNDLEAHNRLGKACFELGVYQKARDAFNGALRLSPSNTIARRNLDRLNLPVYKNHVFVF